MKIRKVLTMMVCIAIMLFGNTSCQNIQSNELTVMKQGEIYIQYKDAVYDAKHLNLLISREYEYSSEFDLEDYLHRYIYDDPGGIICIVTVQGNSFTMIDSPDPYLLTPVKIESIIYQGEQAKLNPDIVQFVVSLNYYPICPREVLPNSSPTDIEYAYHLPEGTFTEQDLDKSYLYTTYGEQMLRYQQSYLVCGVYSNDYHYICLPRREREDVLNWAAFEIIEQNKYEEFWNRFGVFQPLNIRQQYESYFETHLNKFQNSRK